jgi:outer membrane lipoprotein-sorting protein
MPKICMVSLIGLCSLANVHAQTADDIIAKHIQAIGGKDKLSQVKSVTIESSIQVMGNDAPSTSTMVEGKGFRSESEFNGQKLVQVYTDKGGWMINPFAGGTDAQAMPDAQYKSGKDQIYIDGPLYNYAAKGNKVELAGKENVGTAAAYKIKETNADGSTAVYYIDSATYFVDKIVRTSQMNGQDVDINITLTNYQKTDFGIMVAYAVETSFGEQFTLSATLKKIEFNKDIDPKIFDMPK